MINASFVPTLERIDVDFDVQKNDGTYHTSHAAIHLLRQTLMAV